MMTQVQGLSISMQKYSVVPGNQHLNSESIICMVRDLWTMGQVVGCVSPQ